MKLNEFIYRRMIKRGAINEWDVKMNSLLDSLIPDIIRQEISEPTIIEKLNKYNGRIMVLKIRRKDVK